MAQPRRSYLRRQESEVGARVTNGELFLDLVFVYAVTQISHYLLDHFTFTGLIQTSLIFFAIWWLWIFTTWVTNWLDPDRPPVRLLLFIVMFAGMVMALCVPDAFGERGWLFALAYTVTQVGRSGFMLWAIGDRDRDNIRNFQRITVWFLSSSLFWLWGALVSDPNQRLVLWAVAVGIDFVGPWVGFWVPGLGQSKTTHWSIAGGHLAERCSLFIIIVLGETLVTTAIAFSEIEWTPMAWMRLLISFGGTVALWWIYFNKGVEDGARRIGADTDPGRLARLAYSYLHVPIVAGIILSAVADEIGISHGNAPIETGAMVVEVGGPALYLIGMAAFKHVLYGRPPLSHLGGLMMLVVIALIAGLGKGWTRFDLGLAVVCVLILVAFWETWALREKPECQPLRHAP